MNLLNKLFKKEPPEKSKDMSHKRIYDALVAIAKDNNCFIYGSQYNGYIRVPLVYKTVIETFASYCPAGDTETAIIVGNGITEHSVTLSQEIGAVNGYLAILLGIPISFSEDAYAIEYVPNDEKLKNSGYTPLTIQTEYTDSGEIVRVVPLYDEE